MGYIYMLLFIFFLTVNCEEQLCSRFHYEQMTLEKMIRQEMNFEKIRSEIDDVLQGMKKEIADLKSESEECHSAITTLQEVKESKQTLRQEARLVIFHALELQNLKPADGETLVFTNALTNVGSAYNAANGRFTAPLNGTYAFTVQLCMDVGEAFIQYRIVKSTGDALVRSQLGKTTSLYDCDSVSVYAFLKAGESVWVEIRIKTRNKQLKDISNSFWNMFSGVLLNKM